MPGQKKKRKLRRSRYLQAISNTAETAEPTDRSRSRGNTTEIEPTEKKRKRRRSISRSRYQPAPGVYTLSRKSIAMRVGVVLNL